MIASETKLNQAASLQSELFSGSDINEAEVRSALNQVVKQNLPPVCMVLGVLYALLAVSHLLLLPKTVPPSTVALMAALAEVTALVLLIIYLVLTRWPISEKWAHPIGAFIALLVLGNSLINIYFTEDPLQTLTLVLLIIGAGFLFLSPYWLTVIILTTLSGWSAVVWALDPLRVWENYAIPLVSAILLALIIHIARIRSQRDTEILRRDNARRKTELEAVLTSTEAAQRYLATSMAIGQRITSILDLDILLNQVADLIKERFGGNYVGIFLIDDSQEYLVARAGTGEVGRRLVREGFRLKVGAEGIIGWVAEKRRPAWVDEVALDPRYYALESVNDTRSELALPLEMGMTLLGVLDMQSERPAAFKEDDVPFLQTMADQVAIAIQNASLFQVEKSRRRLAEILYSVGRALSGTLMLEEVLGLILSHMNEIVGYDRAAVMLRLDGELETAASRGFPLVTQQQRISIKADDVFQEISRTQRPLHLADVSLRADWEQVEDLPPARAWLGVPLIHSDEVIGMLSLTRESLSPFSPDEISLSAMFASQAAIALHNARLYEQITSFNQALEEKVGQRTEDLEAAYHELERLDKTKSDFIGVASHELRTPITVVHGYCQMLLDDPAIKQNTLHQQLVQGIMSGSTRLNEIVGSLLDTAKIDSRALQLHAVPVVMHTLIDHVSSGLKKAFDERQQKLVIGFEELRALPTIHADPDALRKVFYHLLVNAIKYTPDGGTITISSRVYSGGSDGSEMSAIEVIVRDTGIGIDPNLQELIFTKFYQTGEVAMHSSSKIKFKGGGPGLGLAIARGIVEAHSGRIWAESRGHDEENLPGSEFHVVLPVRN
jgi:signal transduction histidine kinase/putative methionine-R-sulfoxide reductase with GAF domain